MFALSSVLAAAVVAEYGVKQFTSNAVGSAFTAASIIGSSPSSAFNCSAVASTASPFCFFSSSSLICCPRASSSAFCVMMCSISSGRRMNCDEPALCASRFSSSWIQKQSTGWLRMKSSAYTWPSMPRSSFASTGPVNATLPSVAVSGVLQPVVSVFSADSAGVRRMEDSLQCSFSASAATFAATCLSAYTDRHPSTLPYSSMDSAPRYASAPRASPTSLRPGTVVCAR